MRYLLTTVFSILFWILAAGQDVAGLVKEADRLESLPNETGAFNKFREVLKIQPTHLYALVKCSELCSRIGKRQPNKTSMNDYYNAAKIYAETALKLNPASSDANCVMSIAMGRIALSKSGKEKITAAKEIKRYAELAIKYDANNFRAWHVLGKWHYEVSNLNGLERAAAKVFFGGVPAASIKESISAYEKVRALDPAFVVNYLELARAYKRNDEKAKAIAQLKALQLLPNKTEDDVPAKQEAKELLQKWQ